jgi:hypothetical protein
VLYCNHHLVLVLCGVWYWLVSCPAVMWQNYWALKMYVCVCIYIYICVCLHLRHSALRVAKKRIITTNKVFCQPIAELVLLLCVLAEHHGHLQVATNDEDMDSVPCRLSITNVCTCQCHLQIYSTVKII